MDCWLVVGCMLLDAGGVDNLSTWRIGNVVFPEHHDEMIRPLIYLPGGLTMLSFRNITTK